MNNAGLPCVGILAAVLAAVPLTGAAGEVYHSDKICLDKPFLSTPSDFSGNVRRFEVPLAKPLDLSHAAGVSFRVKCADPKMLTSIWLLFRTGDGYYRVSFAVPSEANVWTDRTVLRRDVRLYHWNTHISLLEVQENPAPADLPDWSRVTGFQVVFALDVEQTTPDASVAVCDFSVVPEASAAARAAEAESDAAAARVHAAVAAHPPFRPGRRFLATHVWGLNWNWEETCRMLKEGGITDVIPLMTFAGYAYYGGSKIEIASPLLAKHGDALDLCLAACRKYGMKCHPWRSCWILSSVAPRAIRDQMREQGRLQVSFDGKDGTWLCPTHPANVRREIDGILELSRRGAAGIMLDYFRYPSDKYCFCPRCRANFEVSLGVKVDNWPMAVRSDATLAKAWSAFRRDVLTDVLRTIRREVHREAPSLEFSSAVSAAVEVGVARGQDWPRWCREGLLDRLFPMCYYSSSTMLRHYLGTLHAIVAPTPTVLCPMTCFACGDIPFLDYDEIFRQIDVVQSFGLVDLAFFRLTEYAPLVLSELKK